jgi:predicted RNA-binding Zn-ribbon protein involved in translation (DUF1610 family)
LKTDNEELSRKIVDALSFDAYREQEQLRIKYKHGDNVEGLEDVLYACPSCGSEFTIRVKNKNTLYCEHCGFEHRSDEYGFLHNVGKTDEEIRYVSDWSRLIYSNMYDRLAAGEQMKFMADVKIHTINYKKKKVEEVGEGVLSLNSEAYTLVGTVSGEEREIKIAPSAFPSLPFKPGAYLELQHGKEIFRLYPEDGHQIMKYINFVKIQYELSEPEHSEHLNNLRHLNHA